MHHSASFQPDVFGHRHLGPDGPEVEKMLSTIGVDSVDTLINQTVPKAIRLEQPLALEAAMTERQLLDHMAGLAGQNLVCRNLIGMGYYGTFTPPVIQRTILENPAWYTAYTPYQAEIAQGRLEMLLNFQTVVTDLTGLPLANASLLDEATAAAEAMTMLYAQRDGSKKDANVFFADERCFPQTLDVLVTRSEPVGIKLEIGPLDSLDLTRQDLFGVMLQYPDAYGHIGGIESLIGSAKDQKVMTCVASDLLALCLLTPPGQMGADVVVGSAQRFGVPMGFGGPHAGFFATREEFKRTIPGRLIGVSVDAQGNRALRMALQTREQHIRREKATSNICTAQVLLSVMAAAYAVYHGPEGLKRIARNAHGLAKELANGLKAAGFTLDSDAYFDTVFVRADNSAHLMMAAEKIGININGTLPGGVGISLDELSTPEEVRALIEALTPFAVPASTASIPAKNGSAGQVSCREDAILDYPVFTTYHAEHEMLRYIRRLEGKDISLVHSMIPLGSCTMKLNPAASMMPLSFAGFAHMHPFQPKGQAMGYQAMIDRLEDWLCKITGFAAMSLQPNSGAQGEYAGLLVIKNYLEAKGEGHRTIALIPQSAHGTNPASAVMAGFQVVVTKTDENGNVDIADLEAKADQYADRLGCLMITYPSTHGVFESGIRRITQIIHERGGQVYMDGANMNAQVGLTSPGNIGADVCHLNLHKTFCIPHGGGGPGMGPIGVAAHLAPYLPGHAVVDNGVGEQAGHAVSAAQYGSASILTISYSYIAMMGGDGLTEATRFAILNANYLKARLEGPYPILYSGENGRCAHEFIVDLRPFKQHGIEAEDVAKRLMDYGFHAPTLSFPVAGTLMIEPTESESLAELDRFCEAMLAIRAEIEEVATGKADRKENVLKHAPHTQAVVCADDWTRPYTRQKAAFPLPYVMEDGKVWPAVGRVDNAYGDRNLICTCEPIEAYMEESVSA